MNRSQKPEQLSVAVYWQALYQDNAEWRRQESRLPLSRKGFVRRTLVYLRQGVREEADALMDAVPASRVRH